MQGRVSRAANPLYFVCCRCFTEVTSSDVIKLRDLILQRKKEQARMLFSELEKHHTPSLKLFTPTVPALLKSGDNDLLGQMIKSMVKNNLEMTPELSESALQYYANANNTQMLFSLIQADKNQLRYVTMRNILSTFVQQRQMESFSQFVELLEQKSNKPFSIRQCNDILKNLSQLGDPIGCSLLMKYIEQSQTPPNEDTFRLVARGFLRKNLINEAVNMIDYGTISGYADSVIMRKTAIEIIDHCFRFATTIKKKEAGIEAADRLLKITRHTDVYQAAMKLYIRCDRPGEVNRLYEEMISRGLSPYAMTYRVLIGGLAVALQFDLVKKYLEIFEAKYSVKPQVYEKLIISFGQGNRVAECIYFFKLMPEPTLPAFNAIIRACTAIGEFTSLRELLKNMKSMGLAATPETYLEICSGLVDAGLTQRSYDLVVKGKEYVMVSTDTFNCIMRGFISEQKHGSALAVFQKMEEYDLKPDSTSFVQLIFAFVELGDINTAYKLFKEMNTLLPDYKSVSVYNVMIYGYFVSGNPERVSQMLEMMEKEKMRKHRSTFAILVAGYFKKNLIPEATEALYDMIVAKKFPNTPQEKRAKILFEKRGISSVVIEPLLELLPFQQKKFQ